MLATRQFVKELHSGEKASSVARIAVELFGSLALTGLGHSTDRAAILGLIGEHPQTVEPAHIEPTFAEISRERRLKWNGAHEIEFNLKRDLIFHRDKSLPRHPNGMGCTAYDVSGNVLLERRYYSVGGGFVINDDDDDDGEDATPGSSADGEQPYPFTSCEELLNICRYHHLTMAEVVHRNERSKYSEQEIAERLDAIWHTMRDCIERGTSRSGILPGGLGIKRRAPDLLHKLMATEGQSSIDPLLRIDWVTMFALAVNEENAAGGRVVTAPTNGAAGIIPAVLMYYDRFLPGANLEGIRTFLKTAGAIGMLYKRNASLSAAEMGCQGEVGVACSMAAAGLAAVMGGTPDQVENAAEIGMEHNLGLTCDPIAGLVQIPCIERNTMGAVKAINAARLAVLYGDGKHYVSLDRVIETMRQTGVDMQSKYKETSLGGLAVNVINC